MNHQQLDQIKARALAALPDNSPPNMEKVKAMALFRRHAANDVLELAAEAERLRLLLDNISDAVIKLDQKAVEAGELGEGHPLYKPTMFQVDIMDQKALRIAVEWQEES